MAHGAICGRRARRTRDGRARPLHAGRVGAPVEAVDRGHAVGREPRRACDRISAVAYKLKNDGFKTAIVKVMREFMYDSEFMRKLDANPNLIGFETGVYDLAWWTRVKDNAKLLLAARPHRDKPGCDRGL